jgi:hypothetical protein
LTTVWLGRYRTGGWETISINERQMDWYNAAAVVDLDGPGPQPPRLYLGGFFGTVGLPGQTIAAPCIAAWDGQQWSAVGQYDLCSVHALTSYDRDGSGPARPVLVAAGSNASVRVFDGSTWTPLGGGLERRGRVYTTYHPIALREFDEDGPGPMGRSLFVFDRITHAGGMPVDHLAIWRGDHWAGVAPRPSDQVWALALFNDGSAPGTRRLYAGGAFRRVGTELAPNLARLNGTVWEPAPSGLERTASVPSPYILSMMVHNDRSPFGWGLYVAGRFGRAGGVDVGNIARWNGQAWGRVGQAGFNQDVLCLQVHDPDGPGPLPPALYAGGRFTSVDGMSARHLARWDGTAWAEVVGGTSAPVRTLRTWDDGRGPALYVGGRVMSAGGLPANLIFRLAGSQWESLPAFRLLLYGAVYAISVHDDGDGEHLYVAGEGGIHPVPLRFGVAKLTEARWEPVATMLQQFDSVGRSLRSARFSSGPVLLAGHRYGMVAAPQGGSTFHAGDLGGNVLAISPVFDDGRGEAVYFSGEGTLVIRFGRRTSCYANCDGSVAAPLLTAADFTCFLNSYAQGLTLPPAQQVDHYANCDQSREEPVLNIHDLMCFVERFMAGCP